MENLLSSKEIDTLVDALEAWEKKDFGGRLMSGLFKSILTKDDPIAQAKFEESEREENEKMEREERQRKETSLLLKAKLIGMKQNIEISALAKA